MSRRRLLVAGGGVGAVEALLDPDGARGAAAEMGAALREVPGARLAHAAVSGALTG